MRWSAETQRDFDRWQAKINRALSAAEQRGWRRFWDGGCICPSCMGGRGFFGGPYTPETWRVPANYDTPIKDTEKCLRCRRAPRDVPLTFDEMVAAVVDFFSRS